MPFSILGRFTRSTSTTSLGDLPSGACTSTRRRYLRNSYPNSTKNRSNSAAARSRSARMSLAVTAYLSHRVHRGHQLAAVAAQVVVVLLVQQATQTGQDQRLGRGGVDLAAGLGYQLVLAASHGFDLLLELAQLVLQRFVPRKARLGLGDGSCNRRPSSACARNWPASSGSRLPNATTARMPRRWRSPAHGRPGLR